MSTDATTGKLVRDRFHGTDEDLTEKIIGVFYKVNNELGFAFIELVYARALAISLRESGLRVEAEVAVSVLFHGQSVGTFRADLLVEGRIILECKVAEQIVKAFEAQLLHYLRASSYEIGLILNFGQLPKIRRITFPNQRKRVQPPVQEE